MRISGPQVPKNTRNTWECHAVAAFISANIFLEATMLSSRESLISKQQKAGCVSDVITRLDICSQRFQPVFFFKKLNLLVLIQYWTLTIYQRIQDFNQKFLQFEKIKGFVILFAICKQQLGHKSWFDMQIFDWKGYLMDNLVSLSHFFNLI